MFVMFLLNNYNLFPINYPMMRKQSKERYLHSWHPLHKIIACSTARLKISPLHSTLPFLFRIMIVHYAPANLFNFPPTKI